MRLNVRRIFEFRSLVLYNYRNKEISKHYTIPLSFNVKNIPN